LLADVNAGTIPNDQSYVNLHFSSVLRVQKVDHWIGFHRIAVVIISYRFIAGSACPLKLWGSPENKGSLRRRTTSKESDAILFDDLRKANAGDSIRGIQKVMLSITKSVGLTDDQRNIEYITMNSYCETLKKS
jgi:hypothetical protein